MTRAVPEILAVVTVVAPARLVVPPVAISDGDANELPLDRAELAGLLRSRWKPSGAAGGDRRDAGDAQQGGAETAARFASWPVALTVVPAAPVAESRRSADRVSSCHRPLAEPSVSAWTVAEAGPVTPAGNAE